MKMYFISLAMVFFVSFTNIDHSFATTLPNCTSSASDSDGDGYGWENNTSCVVASISGVCEDRGGYPWGWNPLTETSCRLDVDSGTDNTTIVSDAANCEDRGDYPWGWNPVSETSCRLDTSDTSNNETDSASNGVQESGICIDSDGDGYGWNGSATCDPDRSTATEVSTPMFTNLETGESVVLSLVYWNESDFYKPLTCYWSYFNETEYGVQGGSLYTHSTLTDSGRGYISIGAFSSNSRSWSLQSGIYTSPANPTGSPWIEYVGNGVRFWIDNESFAYCSALNADDSFIPSGTSLPSLDIASDNTNSSSGECVDPDGDGIGNDGFVTCRVSSPSDASWEFCDIAGSRDAELAYGQAWGSQQSRYNQGNTVDSCVRRCGAAAIELPDTPGWSYDSEAGAECIVDESLVEGTTETLSGNANVAVYDITSGGSERQLFEDQFAYPLYYGDATWECSQQTRESNNEEFSSNGEPRIIQFDSSYGGNWYFDKRQWKQTLTIDDGTTQEESFKYNGYAQIHHDTLTVYKTSYDRLSCTRSGAAPDLALPTSISEFQAADSLLLGDLLDQSYQCQLLESLSRGENNSSDAGWIANNIEESVFNAELTFNPTFLGFNDAGERLYQSTQGYIFSELGLILYRVSPAFYGFQFSGDRFFSIQNGTSSYYNHLVARRIGDNIILERNSFYRTSGGGADDLSYYVCPAAN